MVLMRLGFAILLGFGEGDAVRARTLAVVASKHDDVEGVKKLGRLLRSGNEESRAVVIQGALRSWGLIDPELFARIVSS